MIQMKIVNYVKHDVYVIFSLFFMLVSTAHESTSGSDHSHTRALLLILYSAADS